MKPYNLRTSIERRSTDRLQTMLAGLKKQPCECDGFHGYTCGKHHMQDIVEDVLDRRRAGTTRVKAGE